MLKLFSGGGKASSAWQISDVITALKKHYPSVEQLAEDGAVKVFGIEDNGVNFVVALLQSAPGTDEIIEIAFLARFVGFPVTVQTVENLNQNLHISIASLEGPDLYLMAGVAVTGPFDDTLFAHHITSWRRDLIVTLHGISGDSASLSEAFPVTRIEAAREFATNMAPAAESGLPIDVLSSFLGAKSMSKKTCIDCGGRGKRGLIARQCNECDGTGFVAGRR